MQLSSLVELDLSGVTLPVELQQHLTVSSSFTQTSDQHACYIEMSKLLPVFPLHEHARLLEIYTVLM